MKVVDGGAGVPVAVELSEVSPQVVVQDIVVTLAGGGVGMASEMPRLEGFDVAASLLLDGDEAVVNVVDDVPHVPDMGRLRLLDQLGKLPLMTRGKTICTPSRSRIELSFLVMNLIPTSTLKITR